MRFVLALLAVLLLLPPPAAAEQIYRYTDARGVIHFVSSPDDVPAPYRKRMKTVQGQVSRVNAAGEPAAPAPTAAAVPGVPALSDLLPNLEAVALPRPLIVALELWRSRLLFSLLGLLGMVGLFLLGLRYTRDIPAPERPAHRVRLSASFAAVLVLFWLALFGPGVGRMLRGCETVAGQSLEAADNDQQRQRLERFRQLSGRAADAVERLLIAKPV